MLISPALIGKWHVGITKDFHPNRRGFDYFCGHLSGSHTYFPNGEYNNIERNGVAVTDFSSEYLTTFLTDDALRFIDGADRGEANDRAIEDGETLQLLFEELGRWESLLPTVPLWGSLPFWTGESAKIYDNWKSGPEPR